MAQKLLFTIESYAYLEPQFTLGGMFERGGIERKMFPDGERYLRLLDDAWGRDVVLLGGTPSDRDWLEVYDLGCAIARAGARTLSIVMPYFGYATMERAVKPGEVVTAKTRAQREGRTIPFSALQDAARVPEAAVEPERFLPDDHPQYPGHWAVPPRDLPEERLLAAETRERIAAAIDALPASQRAVIALRDVEGWTSDEVRNALDLSEVNQRVLLHRARSKVRRALEDYLAPENP